ncbi:PAS domain-containing protein [Methylobacterium sp. NMS14P]|uniref:CheR family methyltransferase n=1 Tax=unclassified Methylobacterium TaxID=2615210 RepID=UPI00235A16BE|nr:CheR family methyltransferase [Methylobacterium sp. NMS14P]WCS28288.1 PAS domain-containing protein [Methylobacterium sp. NMS14P]
MPPVDVSSSRTSAFVALSASAASTASLQHVLTRLPRLDGVAVIVALQHRDALDEKGFRHALMAIGLELADVRDDALIEGGRTYLIAADLVVGVENGRFRTRLADEVGGKGLIDSFLVSLARDEDGRSIAVALAGTDGDGTLGFKAIKEAGGLTLAEETPEAAAGELAFSETPAALADAVLSLDELVERVAAAARQLDAQGVAAPAASKAALTAIAGVLRNRTGHDFHGYKSGTFLRRVQRRMQVLSLANIDDYIEVLRTQPGEAQELFNDLLIGVTQFFRDPKEFEILEREVIPRLFADKGRDDHIRVWVIGCSTGEEAYSLAILLREHMAMLDHVPQVQIFATDLDGRALASARAARFASTISETMSPERLARWFVKEGNTYCLAKELREMCIFSQHSIIKDPPFSRLDLISCRNLLIYLDADLQGRVIPLFHFALKPDGTLFLGNSENVSRHTDLFAAIDSRSRIFRRRETGTRVLPDFPFSTPDRRIGAPVAVEERTRPIAATLTRRAERLAERYAPAYVITDASYTVLHFSGRTGRYIDPAGGVASLNLLQLAHPDLRLDLRAALTKADETGETVQVDGLQIGQNGGRHAVDLVVEPMRDDPDARSYFVLFKDGGPAMATDGDAAIDATGELERTRRLEAELGITRERLQATIEELESTNEELKSSNEEYQSLNEELQSTNEELQTSKEEQQSINEELTTVNGELGHRVQELGRLNSDLKNFLESTQIATVFLDNELRITNHTPAVTEIFHLIETDAGRPIGHIKSRIAYDELQDDARRVLRTLSVVEREITNSTTGAQYLVRVLPYRSVDNFIAGVVLTFVDITERKRAEERQVASERRLLALVEGIPQLVWRAAEDGQWTWVSPQWSAYTGQTEAQSRNHGWLDAMHPDDRAAAVEAWRTATRTGLLQMEGRLRGAASGGYRWFQMRAMPVRGERGEVVEWLGTSTDIDDLRRMQEQQRVLVAELQHRTRNLLGVVHSIAQQTVAASDTLEAFRSAFNERLGALSRVQGLLSRAEEEPITLGTLIRSELDALAAADLQERVVLTGPDVRIRKATVQTFALALHELATNARKYGALSNSHGQLNVTWWTHEPDGQGPRLTLEWVETGIDRQHGSAGAALRNGYGRELIENALPYALDATTHYELGEAEVRCLIELPLA